MRKRNELGYLAGFFDGEGSIRIGRSCKQRYFILECRVTTAGEYLPRLFQFHFGGSITHRKLRADKTNWHDYYSWSITALKALAFLEAITPYLRLKQPQAEVGIAFQKRIVAYGGGKGRQLTDEERTFRETQFLLMSHLKEESYGVWQEKILDEELRLVKPQRKQLELPLEGELGM